MNCCKCGTLLEWEWSMNCEECVDHDFEAWLINFMEQPGGSYDQTL